MIHIGDAVIKLFGDNSNFKESLNESDSMSNSFFDNFGRMSTKIGVGLSAMGATITASLGGMISNWMNIGSSLKDMAIKAQMGVVPFQELKFAVEQSGGTVDGLSMALQKMNEFIVNGIDEASKQAAIIRFLGISYDELRDSSPDMQFQRIAESIASIQDPAIQTAVAVDIFGMRAGPDLLQTLQLGSRGIQELRNQAHQLGIVLSEEQTAKSKAFGDSWAQIKEQLQIIGITIIDALYPYLEKLGNWLTDNIPKITQFIQENSGIIGSITALIGVFGGLSVVLGPIMVLIGGVAMAFGGIGIAVIAIVSILVAFLLNIDKVMEAIKTLAEYLQFFLIGVWETIVDAWKALSGSIIQIWEEIVNVGYSIWGGIANFFQALWNGIVSTFEWAINSIKAIWNGLTDWIKSAYDWIANKVTWIIDKAKDIGNFITGGIFESNQANEVPAFAKGVTNFIGGMALVGENGPELVNLPRNSSVLPSNVTQQFFNNRNASPTIQVTINQANLKTTSEIMNEIGNVTERAIRKAGFRI